MAKALRRCIHFAHYYIVVSALHVIHQRAYFEFQFKLTAGFAEGIHRHCKLLAGAAVGIEFQHFGRTRARVADRINGAAKKFFAHIAGYVGESLVDVDYALVKLAGTAKAGYQYRGVNDIRYFCQQIW